MYRIETQLLQDLGAQDYDFEGRKGQYRFITIRLDGKIVRMRADVDLLTDGNMLDRKVIVHFNLVPKGDKVEAKAMAVESVA